MIARKTKNITSFLNQFKSLGAIRKRIMLPTAPIRKMRLTVLVEKKVFKNVELTYKRAPKLIDKKNAATKTGTSLNISLCYPDLLELSPPFTKVKPL